MTKSSNGDKCYRICVKEHTHLALKTIVLFLAILMAFIVGKSIGGPNDIQQQAPVIQKSGLNTRSYDEGYQDAIKELEADGVVQRSASGSFKATVKSVDGRNIQVEIDGVSGGKTVQVPDFVKMTGNQVLTAESIEKNPKLKSELDALKKRRDAGEDVGLEVSELLGQFSVREFAINDLKVGDVIRFETEKDPASSDTFEVISVELVSPAPEAQ